MKRFDPSQMLPATDKNVHRLPLWLLLSQSTDQAFKEMKRRFRTAIISIFIDLLIEYRLSSTNDRTKLPAII